jgi:outer membrane receptor protein involved in Fe transport
MNKYFLGLLLLVGFRYQATAQVAELNKGNGQINGVIIDADTKQSLEYATIIVFKTGSNKAINGATTNTQGQFTIKGIDTGVYKINIEFVGAKTMSIDSIKIDKQHLKADLGIIPIVKSATQLKAVVVKSSARLIENKIDKMVFNAEKDISSQGGIATDILKKIPMISVDIDGNVQLSGTSSIRFLINGRPSVAFGSNITDVLQAIPASEIKSVEVITNPGAKYDADGLGGIINIILKQNKTRGYNGNINTSVGTRIENGTLNLNARHNDFGVNMFVANNQRLLAATPMTMNRITSDTINHTQNTIAQDGSSNIKRHGTHAGVNFDWSYLKKNNFTASVTSNDFGFDAVGKNTQNIINRRTTDGFITSNTLLNNQTATSFEGKGIDYSASYKRTFDKEDRELEISFDGGNEKNSIQSSAIQLLAPSNSFVYGSMNNLASTSKESELKLDYTEPLSDKVKLNMGSKLTSMDISSNTDVFRQLSNQTSVKNNSLSTSLDYHLQVKAIYAELEFPIKNVVDVKLGGRFEQTNVHALYSTSSQQIQPNYTNFVPSFFLKRNISEDDNIKFSYSRRINRPGYEELDPYINTTDPKNMSEGNPFLLPEKGERMELSYSHQIKDIGSVMITLFQRNSDQDIQPYVVYYPSLKVGDSVYYNVNVSKSQNIGLEKNTGVNLFGDIKFGTAFTLSSNIAYYYRKIYNSIDHNYNATSQNYRANINLTYEFSKDFVTECFGNFNSARNEVQGKYPANTTYSLAFRKKIWKSKGSIGFVANNPFAEYVKQQVLIAGPNFSSNSIRYIPSRSFGLSFTWKFGKLEFKKEPKEPSTNMEEPTN